MSRTGDGMEHFVFFCGYRWLKITQGSSDSFGFTIGLRDGEPTLVQASALEYLRRLDLANRVFQDDLVWHGVARDAAGHLVMITSQPDYVGEPADLDFIRNSMMSAGFRPLAEIGAFYREFDNVVVMDLHQENAVRDGAQLHVFDAIVSEPSGELLHVIREAMR